MSLLNPTNFLDLVQRYGVDAGITDDPPSTLVGATAQLVTLMNHVNDAWRTIQMLHDDWKFMTVSPGVSFTTTAGQMLYTPTEAGVAAGVTKWLLPTFRVYKTSVGFLSEVPMDPMDYNDWRDMYQVGAMRTSQAQPIAVTVHPDMSLAISCPLVGYTITGDYISAPVGLEEDADIPGLPNRFIMAIVWKALMDYATEESSPEMFAKASTHFDSIMRKMEVSQLPNIYPTGSLA